MVRLGLALKLPLVWISSGLAFNRSQHTAGQMSALFKNTSALIGSALLLVLLCLAGPAAQAQDTNFEQQPVIKKMPKLNAFEAILPDAELDKNKKAVNLDATLTKDGLPMHHGLTWHVFSSIPGSDGKLQLLAQSEGGSATFRLDPGSYFVNVAFGRAGTTKKLEVPSIGEPQKQVLVLDAGGIELNAVSGANMRIPADELSFSIYSSDVKEDGERGLVMDDVSPNEVVRLNAGTYHVVSEYGDVNAVIRADIQVEAGKITEATIQHRAAEIALKLVSTPGGEAIADTAWSVLTASGDIVSESVSAFPSMVLAEGDYSVVARNKEKNYTRDFTVKAGENADIEVLLK